MATKSVKINNQEYTKLDSFPESAVDMQNISKHPVRVIFSTSGKPEKTAKNHYNMDPGQGIPRDGKTGDMYALLMGTGNAYITVGE